MNAAAPGDLGPPLRADPHGGAGAGWLAGRSALVTGGGLSGAEGGVGYAICRLFARHGARVAVIQLGELAPAATACGRPQATQGRPRQVEWRTEGTCWDAAYAALFLASDRARWISGHILTIDGGGPYQAAADGGADHAAAGGAATPGLAAGQAR